MSLLTMPRSPRMPFGSLAEGLVMYFVNISSVFPMPSIFLTISLILMPICFRIKKKSNFSAQF